MTALPLLWLGALGGAGVTLVAADCPPALAERVRDELVACGLEVGEGGPGDVARIELACHAEQRTLEVRIDDRLTDKLVARVLPLEGADARADARAALRVVELLHASLAETRLAHLLKPAVLPAPVERFLDQKAPPPEPSWALGVRGGVAIAPGGFGAEPLVAAAVDRVLGRLELGARVAATVHATKLFGAGGAASVGLVDARAVASLGLELGTRVVVRPTLGVGALFVWATGRAEQGYAGRSVATPTFAPSVGVAAELRVLPWLALLAAVDVSVALPAVEVRFGDELAARIGQPLVVVSLGGVVR